MWPSIILSIHACFEIVFGQRRSDLYWMVWCFCHLSPGSCRIVVGFLSFRVPFERPSTVMHFSFFLTPISFYLLTVGVERYILHMITLNDTQSLGLLWTRDRPVAETSAWQHTTLKRDRHPCSAGGIWTQRSSNRAATGIGCNTLLGSLKD